MARIDEEFQDLCKKIKSEGRKYTDERRSVERLQIPSYTFRHNIVADGFPAITNKKLYWKGIITELIWFLRGDNDVKYLNDNGVKIWNDDAYNWYVKNCESHEITPMSFEDFSAEGKGSVGQNYSVQWRTFNGEIDQIADVIRDAIENIMGSRLKVNAWNPSEVNLTALPPCHSEFQLIGVPLSGEEKIQWAMNNLDLPLENVAITEAAFDPKQTPQFGFEMHWNQRSVDTFLGLPFNIASYAALGRIISEIIGYPILGIEGTLKCVHFYGNQYDAVDILLSRDPNTHEQCYMRGSLAFRDNCKLFRESKMSLDELFNSMAPKDFILDGYTSDEEIKVKMLAPTKL